MAINNLCNWNQLSLSTFDDDFIEEFNKVISDESVPHAEESTTEEEYTPDSCDNFINMELGMPRGQDGELQHATVKR